MSEIVITGATGLIGSHLTELLIERGDKITILTRSKKNVDPAIAGKIEVIEWEGNGSQLQPGLFEGKDAVIHLAGAGIADKRWTDEYKDIIYKSRIASTAAIVEAIGEAGEKPDVFICGSAVGIYGDCGDDAITENHPAASGFLAEVCSDWEEEAAKIEKFNVRRVSLRTGVVLSTKGGALKKMLLPFKLFVGGPLGSGKQWFPWIHIDDMAQAILFALDNKQLRGAVNMTAPDPVRMKTFAKVMGKLLKRPSFFPVPAFVLKIILGKAAEATLASQRVIPQKLIDSGFNFSFPLVKDALKNLLGK